MIIIVASEFYQVQLRRFLEVGHPLFQRSALADGAEFRAFRYILSLSPEEHGRERPHGLTVTVSFSSW